MTDKTKDKTAATTPGRKPEQHKKKPDKAVYNPVNMAGRQADIVTEHEEDAREEKRETDPPAASGRNRQPPPPKP